MNHHLRILRCEKDKKELKGLLLNADFERLFTIECRTTELMLSTIRPSVSIFYYFHNVIVYLVFVKSIQNDLFEENSAVTNNHIPGESFCIIAAVNILRCKTSV